MADSVQHDSTWLKEKVALVFPGQGIQHVGMGRYLYDHFPSARAVIDQADVILGFKLSRLMFEGPAEELEDTINAQPAILTVSVAALEATKVDARYNVEPPEGGLVVRVHAKVLGGYADSADQWERIFQTAVSRDNLWITRDEHQSLVRGQVPRSLQVRIARFHLVDNTRGEPPMWRADEIRTLEMSLRDGQLAGRVVLSTRGGDRGYEATLQGRVEVQAGRVVGFNLVSLGQFWGEGPFTRNAPPGRFPLGVSFTLADGSDLADRVPPQGSRGWVAGYLQ